MKKFAIALAACAAAGLTACSSGSPAAIAVPTTPISGRVPGDNGMLLPVVSCWISTGNDIVISVTDTEGKADCGQVVTGMNRVMPAGNTASETPALTSGEMTIASDLCEGTWSGYLVTVVYLQAPQPGTGAQVCGALRLSY